MAQMLCTFVDRVIPARCDSSSSPSRRRHRVKDAAHPAQTTHDTVYALLRIL
jgi:hypothetical protein